MNRVLQSTTSIALIALAANFASGQIGERPAVDRHINQTDVNAGRTNFRQLFNQGRLIFDARFNSLDGRGRPASTGTGAPRVPDEPAFIRTSGPDATSCAGCHNQPRSGGAGDFVANVFVLAQAADPVQMSVSPMFSNERNTLGMNGAGPIEMLAREMTAELQAIKTSATQAAAQSGQNVTRTLTAKGVSFGSITVLPDGRVDPTNIQGVDWDLIVKPFHQKGAVVSIREFNNNALNHHHGMQTVERFGAGVDPDQDNVTNEVTVGDVTALTIYQAGLNVPGQVIPDGRENRERREAIQRGQQVFGTISCTACHIPSFTLNSRDFTEPNPYNPVGNLRVADVPTVYRFDMTRDGVQPGLERANGNRAIVRPFTDLKRHNLNDAQLNHFANEQVVQGTLAGFAPASQFTIAPLPRPTNQFLTRKLWDCGSTAPYGHRGDLTTITEAIYWHGGEARASRDAFMALPQRDKDCIVEFLKSLQIRDVQGH